MLVSVYVNVKMLHLVVAFINSTTHHDIFYLDYFAEILILRGSILLSLILFV